MGLFDSITRFIRKESVDIGDALGDATESLDRDLARKERELTATPGERIEQLQGEIDNDPFAAIRNRIDASTAHAAAETDVDAIDGPVLDGSDTATEVSDDTITTIEATSDTIMIEPVTIEPVTIEPVTIEPVTADDREVGAANPDEA